MFEKQRQGAIDVIQGDAALTAEHLPAATRLCDESLAGGQPRVVFDLGRVGLFDSAGLEWLLSTQERFVQRGGALKLAAANPLCRDILMVTGLDRHFELFPDTMTAVGSFAR
jgi:anti-anti-sigma factor